MLRKLLLFIMLLLIAIPSIASAQVAVAPDEAFVRVLQLVNDGTPVSLTLEDGRPLLTNFTPGSVSEFFPYAVNRSSVITFVVTPTGRNAYTQTWTVPPLADGYHTLALVGSAVDNTLQLITVDEDALCEGKLSNGTCIILINSIRNSPALTLNVDGRGVILNAGYRQIVVEGVDAGGYRQVTAVNPPTPQTPVFRVEQGYFEPNVITLLTMSGNYVNGQVQNAQIGTIRRVPVNIITFLRGLTAARQITDGTTLYATENIVALIDLVGFDNLLTNPNFPLTIFAPTDAAVLAVSPTLYECVMSDTVAMRELIFNHVIVGDFTPAELVSEGTLPTLAGTTHTFRAAQGATVIDDTVVVDNALHYPTSSGSVYLTDTVLIPEGFEDEFCTQG